MASSDSKIEELSDLIAFLEGQSTRAQESRRENVFGWFLGEWHAGRLDSARSIQNLEYSASTTHRAMQFLLDDTYSVERLREELPDEEPAAREPQGLESSVADEQHPSPPVEDSSGVIG